MTPVSSSTSRRTASSIVSPGSTKPASVEKRPCGQAGLRPSSARSSGLPGSPSVTTMITAGSERGNWSRPQLVQCSTCPACRGSSAPPHRGQCWVAQSHSASPIACSTSGPSAMVSSASDCTIARSTTHSSRSPGASSGSTITAKCSTPSRSPSSTRRPSGASCGETQASRPSTGRTRAPAITSTRVAGIGPPLVEPVLVGAQHAVPVVRVLGEGDVRQHPAHLGHRASSASSGPEASQAAIGAVVVGPAEEVGDQVGGVLRAPGREHGVAVAVRDLGREQVVAVEGGEQVLRDHQRPRVGVVRRAVVVEVAEAGVEVGVRHQLDQAVALEQLAAAGRSGRPGAPGGTSTRSRRTPSGCGSGSPCRTRRPRASAATRSSGIGSPCGVGGEAAQHARRPRPTPRASATAPRRSPTRWRRRRSAPTRAARRARGASGGRTRGTA